MINIISLIYCGFNSRTLNNNTIIDINKYQKEIIDILIEKYNNNNSFFIILQNYNDNINLQTILNMLPDQFDNFAEIFNKNKNLVILFNTKYNKILFKEDLKIDSDNYIQFLCFFENIIIINILNNLNYTLCLIKIYKFITKISKKINLDNYRFIIVGNFTNTIYNKLKLILIKFINISDDNISTYDNLYDSLNNVISYEKIPNENDILIHAEL
jgi:hypothetical protein